MNTPVETTAGDRIPTLDGWRGIAIALVLVDHIQYAVLHRYAWSWTQTGQHGVTIFFVLSGFLITSKLLQGPIDLRRFYVRRFFRLMPAAWTYVATLLVLGWLTHASLTSPAAVRACLLCYRNFVGGIDGLTGHFWSLSLEEQFYLLWPCLLLLAGARRCRWIAAGGALGCACYRWLHWTHYDHNVINEQTQVRADALLVGCLLALVLQDAHLRARVARWSRAWAVPAFAALVFSVARFHWLPPFYESVCIAGLIAASALNSDSALARPLASPALAWMGAVSYSIYVWQALFMALASGFGTVGVTIVALCFAMPLFVLGSYYLIERPSTRLGHRLTRHLRRVITGPAPERSTLEVA